LKIKLKGHHFDTNEAVLQAVLEHPQNAFKKMAEALGMVHMHRRDYFKGDGSL
jgi:hypothetical protein